MEELQHPILRWDNWSMEGAEQLPQGYRVSWDLTPGSLAVEPGVLFPRHSPTTLDVHREGWRKHELHDKGKKET